MKVVIRDNPENPDLFEVSGTISPSEGESPEEFMQVIIDHAKRKFADANSQSNQE